MSSSKPWYTTLHPNPHPGPECFWWSFADWLGSPNVKWCERTICHFISEPFNCLSNLAYVFTSCLMWYLILKQASEANNSSNSSKNKSKKRSGYNLWTSSALVTMPSALLAFFPIANFVMGACSGIYHMSNFSLSQFLDFVGMFVMTGCIAALSRVRVNRLRALEARLKIFDGEDLERLSAVDEDDELLRAELTGGPRPFDASDDDDEESDDSGNARSRSRRKKSAARGGGQQQGKNKHEKEMAEIAKNDPFSVSATPTDIERTDFYVWFTVVTALSFMPVPIMYYFVRGVPFQSLVFLSVLVIIYVEQMYVRPAELRVVNRILATVAAKEQAQARQELDARFSAGWWHLGVGFMAVASIASLVDLKRIWCVPDFHYLTGHGAWHFFSALGIFFVWMHLRLRSEKN